MRLAETLVGLHLSSASPGAHSNVTQPLPQVSTPRHPWKNVLHSKLPLWVYFLESPKRLLISKKKSSMTIRKRGLVRKLFTGVIWWPWNPFQSRQRMKRCPSGEQKGLGSEEVLGVWEEAGRRQGWFVYTPKIHSQCLGVRDLTGAKLELLVDIISAGSKQEVL